jgi:hypothetical protein
MFVRSLLIAGLAAVVPGAAVPCVFAPMTEQQQRTGVREFLRNAAVIVDGEVTRPNAGHDGLAIIRAHRVLKGPRRKEFLVRVHTSCTEHLGNIGQRDRFVLAEGPDVYTVPSHPYDPALIDEVLHSDRRIDWPPQAGARPK